MNLFGTSHKCKKFFTYESKTLNIKGLAAKVGSEKFDNFNLSIGEIEIKPQYVEATQKLQELDLLQFSICSNIQQLKDTDPNKPTLLKTLIETQILMLRIAQNPEKHTQSISEKALDLNITARNNDNQFINNLIEKGEIKTALQNLKNSLSDKKIIVLFMSQYNDLENLMNTGILTKTSVEYKDFVSRLHSYINGLTDNDFK